MKLLSTVKAAVIAGLYAALVILLAPISFYAFQIRVADALLILPFMDFFGFPSIIGLTVGCAIANIYSPFGIIDIVFGSLANFSAGLVAWIIGRRSKSIWALIVAAILETIVVSAIIGYFVLHLIGGLELTVAFLGVLVGSVVSICILGVTLVLFLMKGLRIN
ncbi:MAG: QueT transporter family protein [Desulfurococcaceae archaeon]